MICSLLFLRPRYPARLAMRSKVYQLGKMLFGLTSRLPLNRPQFWRIIGRENVWRRNETKTWELFFSWTPKEIQPRLRDYTEEDYLLGNCDIDFFSFAIAFIWQKFLKFEKDQNGAEKIPMGINVSKKLQNSIRAWSWRMHIKVQNRELIQKY